MRFFSILLAALILQSQEAPKPARLLGKAINAATNEPVRKASIQLQLQKAGDQNFATTTDNDGAFAFENLPPGDYRLTGEKPGFLRSTYGARTPTSRGSLVSVAPGADRKDLLLRLSPAAVVSGRVFDEDGEPMEGANASILLRTEVNGSLRWERRLSLLTNERGEFRISGIPPGPARLSVHINRPSPVGIENSSYGTTYFPGVDSLDQAQTLQLQPGQELSGLQLSLRRTRVYRIRGRYTGPLNAPNSQRPQIMIRHADPSSSAVGIGGAGLNPKDGSFEFTNVLPGTYNLSVVHYQSSGLQFAGGTDVSVGAADLEDVLIEPQTPLTLSGRIRLEQDPQTKPALDITSLRIQTLPFDLSVVSLSIPVPVTPDGSFHIPALPPGRYRINILAAAGSIYVKSLRAAGRELADYTLDLNASTQLEIVVSTKLAKLNGTVQSSQPDSLPGFIALEKIGAPSGVTGQSLTYGVADTGAFDAGAIAPGNYRLYAFEELDLIYLRDPIFLKKFAPRAIELKIAENETQTVALKQIAFAEVEAALKEQ